MSDFEMEFTGERYVTSVKGKIELEHIHRYLLAMEYVKGKDILDIASGEGYGSALLSFSAAKVTGVDIDMQAVIHASRKYKRDNIKFVQGSGENIPFDNHRFDVVVSFETIEHIENPYKMVEEVKRVLKPGGIYIVSTPNIEEYVTLEEGNPFHHKEFTKDEFSEMLSEKFKYHKLLGQRVHFGSGILPCDCEADIVYFDYKDGNYFDILSGKQKDFSGAEYFIAVCCDEPIDNFIGSFMCQKLQYSEEFQHLIDRISQQNNTNCNLEKEVEARGNAINTLQAEVDKQKERLSVIPVLEKEVDARGNAIITLQAEVDKQKERLSVIPVLEKEVEDRGNAIITLQTEVDKQKE
ncbi:MAG: methyltransferase domain-containing protein, partial [Deferribacterales bacterium]|nr:methyltransferase domain-containing protein [Deferribacterales bacterium]